AGKSWKKWTEGFPTVSVKDLVIHPREHDLVIGTFGRAAWVLDDIRPLREIARNTTLLNKKMELFPPAIAYQAAYQQPTGSRFGADAMYQGKNKGFGAQLAYYVKVQKQEKGKGKGKGKLDSTKIKSKIKWDSLTMKIYDGERLIRTLKRKTPKETGIYKWTWYLNEKGVDRPTRSTRKQTREPSGVTVKPGTYKVVMQYGNITSEESLIVKSDPRLEVSTASINEVYTTLKVLENYQQTIADAVKQLVESKNIAKKYQRELKTLDKKKYKIAIDSSKSIIKELDKILDSYLGKIDTRQGITRNAEVTVNQTLGLAKSYVRSRKSGITQTENILVKNAKEAVNTALINTNIFFEKKWKPYQLQMEALQISVFKEIKAFGVN
ncbi:MAG: hypothetical protein ACPG6B_10480, partial [Oceanihabitans sp.]